jgi:hypothetical protein
MEDKIATNNLICFNFLINEKRTNKKAHQNRWALKVPIL